MNPGRPITLEPAKRRWRVFFNNHVIADSDDALILNEAGRGPVVYFPRQDVAMEYMGRTAHRTFCPYKGHADHFTLTLGGEILENVAWSYEEPLDAVSRIGGRIAFYADRVKVYPVDDALVNPHREQRDEPPRDWEILGDRASDVTPREEIDEIVQHTDAGDGHAQRDRWPANVGAPDPKESGLP